MYAFGLLEDVPEEVITDFFMESLKISLCVSVVLAVVIIGVFYLVYGVWNTRTPINQPPKK